MTKMLRYITKTKPIEIAHVVDGILFLQGPTADSVNFIKINCS